MAQAMEITKYPNSPLIKSTDDKSVLVFYDGDIEYMLGYITKGDTTNQIHMYSQLFSSSYGHTLNDIYNSIQNSDDIGATQSKKERTVLVGENKFIGSRFHDGSFTEYGFRNPIFYQTKDYQGYDGEEAPVAPTFADEVDYTLLDGGNKIYNSSSGSLQEFNAMRINIGVANADIHSYGTWDTSLLSVETPIARSVRSMAGISYASGSRSGTAGAFPNELTYHIFNFEDNSSFFMGKGIIEIEKANNDNSTYAKTVYDADGVTISVDSGSKVTLSVDGAPATTLVIEDGVVTITTPSMSYDGNVIITGTLQVEGKTTLDTELDVGGGKVVVNAAGKFLTIGGNALA